MITLLNFGDKTLSESMVKMSTLKTEFGEALFGTIIPDNNRAQQPSSTIRKLIEKLAKKEVCIGKNADKIYVEYKGEETTQLAKCTVGSGYLLSSAAEIDASGNMIPYSTSHIGTIFVAAMLGNLMSLNTIVNALVEEAVAIAASGDTSSSRYARLIVIITSCIHYSRKIDAVPEVKYAMELVTPVVELNEADTKENVEFEEEFGFGAKWSIFNKKEEAEEPVAPATEPVAEEPKKRRGRPRKVAVAAKEESEETVSLVGKYEISERELTEDEKTLVPTIPSWYKMPKWVERIASDIKASSVFSQAYRNVCLIGPAGTGKTKAVQVLAALWNRPHVIETCSPDDDIDKFIGRVMPKTDGTEGFEYVESNLIKALELGWVCEIQEPTILKRSSVLAGLNAIMENDSETAVISLPNGKTVKRHPDAVIVITSNSNYDGCKGIQQSVLSRMDLVREVKNPTEAEMAERCKNQTGFADDKKLALMVKTVRDMSEYAENNGITDGVIGPRELNSWAKKAMLLAAAVGGVVTDDEIVQAAFDTILAKATQDPDDRESLITSSFKKSWSISLVDKYSKLYKDGEI